MSDDRVWMECPGTAGGTPGFLAALGGLESFVLAGGIGENSREVRRRVCEGLGFLGVDVDEGRNVAGGPLSSTPSSPASVRVNRTDEETVFAREAVHLGVGPSIESLPKEPTAVMSQGADRWTRR